MLVTAHQPWWPLSPWLSPGAAWFIFFNAVVAAIAVMSSCTQQQQEGHAPSSRRRLRRSASSTVLDQLRSFSLFSVHPTAGGNGIAVPPLDHLAGVSDSDCYHCLQEAELVSQVTQVPVVVLETPRSTESAAGGGEGVGMAALTIAPSAPVATPSEADSASVSESKDEETDAEEEQDKSMTLDEAYSMVQRLRRPLTAPSAPAAAAAPVATTTAASWPQKTEDLAAKVPIKRRCGRGAAEAPEGKGELNARAELFIQQFREDLKLQRLNSLLRHTHAFGSLDSTPSTVR